MSTEVYDNLNRAWKSTCKVILGEEIGELSEYEKWLTRYLEPSGTKKSAISGKGVVVSSDDFCQSAKFLSLDEVDQYMKTIGNGKFNINDVKDLDSIIEATREKAYYTGNIVLGNSLHVDSVNRCINSSFVYKTQDVYDCKYIAYSSVLRFAEYIFGSSGIGEGCKFNIKIFETYKNVRCMETIRNYVASDCYFTGSMENCGNCMFSFNQRNKNCMIGNYQFAPDEYHKLKEKLVEDIRETLKAKKMVPSLIDIINGDAHV